MPCFSYRDELDDSYISFLRDNDDHYYQFCKGNIHLIIDEENHKKLFFGDKNKPDYEVEVIYRESPTLEYKMTIINNIPGSNYRPFDPPTDLKKVITYYNFSIGLLKPEKEHMAYTYSLFKKALEQDKIKEWFYDFSFRQFDASADYKITSIKISEDKVKTIYCTYVAEKTNKLKYKYVTD